MNYRIKDRNNGNIIENTKNFQLTPDFIEKNILIPQIKIIIKTISVLFEEMEEIHRKLQDDNTEYAQDFNKDLKEMLIVYNQTKFTSTDPVIKNQIEDDAKNEVNEMKEKLQEGFSSHLEQYKKLLEGLGQIHNHENNMEKIHEYMIKAQSFMSHIVKFKKKIFSYIIPMTTLVMIDSKTNKEIKRYPKDHPVERIGLLPFDTKIDEIASLCENGIKSINSWFKHLQNKRIQYMENIVNQSKVHSAQEQTKAAKWTFYTQLGFMVLSVLFIIASYSLSEYKEDWIDLFTNKQKVTKTVIKNGDVSKSFPTREKNSNNN